MYEAQSVAGADASIYMAITGRAPVVHEAPPKRISFGWSRVKETCLRHAPRISLQRVRDAIPLPSRVVRLFS